MQEGNEMADSALARNPHHQEFAPDGFAVLIHMHVVERREHIGRH